jgi:hypothetical protein
MASFGLRAGSTTAIVLDSGDDVVAHFGEPKLAFTRTRVRVGKSVFFPNRRGDKILKVNNELFFIPEDRSVYPELTGDEIYISSLEGWERNDQFSFRRRPPFRVVQIPDGLTIAVRKTEGGYAHGNAPDWILIGKNDELSVISKGFVDLKLILEG